MRELRQSEETDVAYDADFFEWTRHTASLIRAGRFDAIDLEHVAEEIEDMGKRDRREVRSRLIVLVMHLLKWQFQSNKREGSSWRATVVEQRLQIDLVLNDSPSLRNLPKNELSSIYRKAVRAAIDETGLRPNAFPSRCPYSAEEILERRFFPGD